ncbi:MAG: hypothetical protein COA54_02680 [Thiotrichaceae bacterium]|nr:MAG: hypothetical protein COA54_02680 [Thiotrichaceae bacterium]
MPDFDSRTIPTLDDIIKPVVPEDSDTDGSDIKNGDNQIEPIVTDSEPVLFTAEPAIDFTDEADIDDTESEFKSETAFNFAEKNEDTELTLEHNPPELTTEEDSENLESALINDDALSYNTTNYSSEESIPAIDVASFTDEFKTDKQPNEQPLTLQSPTRITDTELQSISDDIVLQLMPELEQRLRVLVKQVLEEKLPHDMIQFDSTSTRNIND